MDSSMTTEIAAWEYEGGAVQAPFALAEDGMSGTAHQIEWARLIKSRVNNDFDRVAASFQSIAAKQHGDIRAATEAVIAILEDKRSEVMSRQQAGYFIHDWQEITDQVRQMIFRDERYQAIKRKRSALPLSTNRQEQG